MGKVIIQEYTTKNPIQMIGHEAGVCWGADVSDPEKNYKRGIDCLESEHGRTWEYPDIYTIIDGYSARVIREWFTHLGGMPSRLQSSTRYINYKEFDFVVPPTISSNDEAYKIYIDTIDKIKEGLIALESLAPREDIALLLPLGMTTKIVDKRNFRNITDMCKQRLCTRAYHEYRRLMNDYLSALSEYSEEWKYLVDHYCKCKCDITGYCKEKKSCGRKPKYTEE